MKHLILSIVITSAWCSMAASFAEDKSTPVSAAGDTSPGAILVTHAAMGTEFEFTIFARPDDTDTDPIVEIANEAFRAIDDLERRISSWISDSQTTYPGSGRGRRASETAEVSKRKATYSNLGRERVARLSARCSNAAANSSPSSYRPTTLARPPAGLAARNRSSCAIRAAGTTAATGLP